MFGAPVQFILSGDRPTLVQSQSRNYAAFVAAKTTTHGITITNVPINTGSRKCTKRGDFAPPPYARIRSNKEPAVTDAAPPEPTKAPRRRNPRKPKARADNEDANLFAEFAPPSPATDPSATGEGKAKADPAPAPPGISPRHNPPSRKTRQAKHASRTKASNTSSSWTRCLQHTTPSEKMNATDLTDITKGDREAYDQTPSIQELAHQEIATTPTSKWHSKPTSTALTANLCHPAPSTSAGLLIVDSPDQLTAVNNIINKTNLWAEVREGHPHTPTPIVLMGPGSVNMGRRNPATHTLLQLNDEDDILCVQEPWWGRIGVKRADRFENGEEVFGAAAHTNWLVEHPYFEPHQRPKVVTYVRKYDRVDGRKPQILQLTARNDLVQHPCILITDVRAGKERWRIVNFYNDVEDPTALTALRSLQLGDEIPTLLVGDFNTHSRTWSPLGWNASSGAEALERWAATNTLELLTIPGLPTRRGQAAQNQRDSVLDLVWRNFAAIVRGTFQGAMIDWPGSFGSDHALIRTLACTPLHEKPPKTDATSRFDLDIDRDKWLRWFQIVERLAPVLQAPPQSPAEIDTILDLIYAAINTACTEVMPKKGRQCAHSARWWTPECTEAANRVQEVTGEYERQACSRYLKR
ncbi:hypothetical protein EDB84DRAFT_1564157 [Lactarius hengduanensis]|nr:hypothetical protein EDB84DRAFT_1564157 [Lactarius hengduanensis]